MPEGSFNVARFLSHRASDCPEKLSLRIPLRNGSGSLQGLRDFTFAQLEQMASRAAATLEDAGIREGTRTLIMVRPGLELILGVFALFRLGAVPVVIDPGMGLRSFLSCVRKTRPEAMVGIPLAHPISRVFSRSFSTLKNRAVVNAAWSQSLADPSFRRETKPVLERAADDLAAILFTSGSTGSPKGVCYTHGMFDGQVASLQAAYPPVPNQVDFPFLPIFSLFNPAFGATTVVPEVNPSKPARFNPGHAVEVMEATGVNTSFGSPVLWRKMVEFLESRSKPLPQMQRILMAGAAAPPQLLERCRKCFPEARIETPYGATEVLPVASIEARTILSETAEASITGAGLCVGRAFPNVTIKILSPEEGPLCASSLEKVLPPGSRGEIVVTGPTVTRVYDGLPEATRLAKIEDPSGQIWHRMGDIGYLDQSERLWFCGRKAERIQTAHGPLDPECVECFLNTHPEVLRSALVSYGREGKHFPILAAELRPGSPYRFPWQKRRLEKELLNYFRKSSGITEIHAVCLTGPFPVDVRHNAKIHRKELGLTISRQRQLAPR